MKITPEVITKLKKNAVFVFGSNESGFHGGGAARLAYEKFGAVYGVGFGHQGKTFAIPTLGWRLERLNLQLIEWHVDRFLVYASLNPKLTFYVTKIGTGIAGYQIADMARLFANKTIPDNVALPQEFIAALTKIIDI